MSDRELKDFKGQHTALGSTWRETELLASTKPVAQSQWNDTEFSLYRYTPNYHYETVTDAFPSTSPPPEQQSSDRGSGFSSLSLIGSSVATDREHFLREQIATKMSQGSLYCGSGQVTSLEQSTFPQPSQMYYCLLEAASGAEGGVPDTAVAESGLTSPLRVDSRRQYVVCFAMISKTGLELFRTELDSFCTQSVAPLLLDQSAEKVIKSFQGSSLQALMGEWFNQRVEYITRVVQLCQKVLPILLHAAIDSEMEVTGPNQTNVRDVRLFLDTCSMASLMQLEGETKISPSPLTRNKVTITASHNSCTLSSEESSQFCSNWAQVLLAHGASSPDPFFLRQAVENYKLKIVQDLNAFKRLLREAESDYHALYRCYLFLCACGNGKLLLQCVLQEATALQVTTTLAVLEVLQTFSKKSGFRKTTTLK